MSGVEAVAAGIMPMVAWAAALATAAAAVCGGVLVRGTTAVPAAAWAAAAAILLAVDLAGLDIRDAAAAANLRLVVVAASVCPTMALLGAKRPQHGVWQFIVLTLAVVLALPAATAALVRPGSQPDVHPLAMWFLAGLVVVGWMNFVGTRHGVAATLVAVGQAVLARRFLPLPTPAAWATGGVDRLAACCVAAGGLDAVGQSLAACARRRPPADRTAAIDTAFCAIRETLGAAWALRIAERFNAAAASHGWPVRLGFSGVETVATPAPWERDAARTFRSLARRFVSDAWLVRHGWK